MIVWSCLLLFDRVHFGLCWIFRLQFVRASKQACFLGPEEGNPDRLFSNSRRNSPAMDFQAPGFKSGVLHSSLGFVDRRVMSDDEWMTIDFSHTA